MSNTQNINLTDDELRRIDDEAFAEVHDDGREASFTDACQTLRAKCELAGLPDPPQRVIEAAVRSAALQFIAGASGVFSQAGLPNPLDDITEENKP